MNYRYIFFNTFRVFIQFESMFAHSVRQRSKPLDTQLSPATFAAKIVLYPRNGFSILTRHPDPRCMGLFYTSHYISLICMPRVSVSLLLTICPCIFIHKFPLSVFHSYKRSWKFITRRQEAHKHTLCWLGGKRSLSSPRLDVTHQSQRKQEMGMCC